MPLLPKISVINRSINSLVGRKFHKGVCVCVLLGRWKKGEGGKKRKAVTRLSESPRCDTDAILVTGKTPRLLASTGIPFTLAGVHVSLSCTVCVESLNAHGKFCW